jgi:hypothetical protein
LGALNIINYNLLVEYFELNTFELIMFGSSLSKMFYFFLKPVFFLLRFLIALGSYLWNYEYVEQEAGIEKIWVLDYQNPYAYIEKEHPKISFCPMRWVLFACLIFYVLHTEIGLGVFMGMMLNGTIFSMSLVGGSLFWFGIFARIFG